MSESHPTPENSLNLAFLPVSGKFREKAQNHQILSVFGITFPKNYISVTRNLFLELISQKITYHVFICDSENYMEKLFGNIFLENLISVTSNNVFGIIFAIISGWCVEDIGNNMGKIQVLAS